MTNPNQLPGDHESKTSSFDYAAAFEEAQQVAAGQTPEANSETIPDELGNEALDLLFDDLQYEWTKYNDFARDTKPSFTTEAEVVDTALKFVQQKPVGVEVRRPEETDDPEEAARGERVQLAIGGQAVAGIRFYVQGHTADLDYIGVHSKLEHHGLGRRLMQAALAYMKDHGITDLESRNLSRDGLRNRIAVFGGDNLKFYYKDDHRQHGIEGEPPANIQEAQAALERAYAKLEAEEIEEEGSFDGLARGDAPRTFAVHSDLTKVDAADWERPIPATISELRVKYQAA